MIISKRFQKHDLDANVMPYYGFSLNTTTQSLYRAISLYNAF